MTGKKLIILGSITLLLGVALAIVKSDSDSFKSSEAGLQLSIGEQKLHKIKIVTSDQTLELARDTSDDWTLSSLGDLAVSKGRVDLVFQKLSAITQGEKIEATSSYYNRLKLETPKPGNAKNSGTLIELYDSGDSVHQAIIIGKAIPHKKSGGGLYSAWFPDRRYMRILGNDADIWLINDPLDEISTDPVDWIDSKLRFIDTPRKATISLNNSNPRESSSLSPEELNFLTNAELASITPRASFKQPTPVHFTLTDQNGSQWKLGIGIAESHQGSNYIEKVSKGMLSSNRSGNRYPLIVLEGPETSPANARWRNYVLYIKSTALEEILNKRPVINSALKSKP